MIPQTNMLVGERPTQNIKKNTSEQRIFQEQTFPSQAGVVARIHGTCVAK
jgi:hypothetical protein